jgi:hypothetical protein
LRFSAPLPDGLEEGEGGPTAEELEGDLEELDLDADQTGTRENIREARLEPLERKVWAAADVKEHVDAIFTRDSVV